VARRAVSRFFALHQLPPTLKKRDGDRGGGEILRPRRRWEDNVTMYFKEMECWDKDWFHLAQDRDQW
jgi:hypothetical protein